MRASSRHVAGDRGREHLRLVDDDEHRIPVVAVGVEHGVQEDAGRAHLLLDLETLQRKHAGDAVLADAGGDADQFGVGALTLDHHVAELVGERDEVALGIDDALLHPGGGLLEQTPEQMRLAGAGIALHQQARRKQFLDIERGRRAALRRSHVDADLHPILVLKIQSICRSVATGKTVRPSMNWRRAAHRLPKPTALRIGPARAVIVRALP